MLKTAKELKEQAEKIGLEFYPIHKCSICQYMCGYIIRDGEVAYDHGCDCTTYSNIRPTSWSDLAKTYNLNQPENNSDIKETFLKELNEIWKFKKITKKDEKSTK